ncbi:hypothetical protein, partial [Methanospirillum purgamenti]|uniref:hypothetical protein n=1 Tax=Methanospirillum purgamenti TaxID=2834276 RepID=UPI002A2424A9
IHPFNECIISPLIHQKLPDIRDEGLHLEPVPFSHDITAGTGQGGLLSNGTGAGLGGLFIMLIPPEHGG